MFDCVDCNFHSTTDWVEHHNISGWSTSKQQGPNHLFSVSRRLDVKNLLIRQKNSHHVGATKDGKDFETHLGKQDFEEITLVFDDFLHAAFSRSNNCYVRKELLIGLTRC
jgi:hypothetical protein